VTLGALGFASGQSFIVFLLTIQIEGCAIVNIPEPVLTELNALKENFPFFGRYTLNRFGAPELDGSSIFDMGLFLLIMDEMGPSGNSVTLAELLSVVKLTVKNWCKKLENHACCEIPSCSSAKAAHYEVLDWGVYDRSFYETFRPYARSIISEWRTHKHVSTSEEPEL
jgi:hypothetical protein